MNAASQSSRVAVADESGVGEARRAARRVARTLALPEISAEQAAIVASEAARNALAHAGGGEVLVSRAPGGGAVDVLAVDRGPGIPDLERALRDGFSTAGTAGQGLGAMRRLASSFDIYSTSSGTAVFARVGTSRLAWDLGAVCVALEHESACGDAWGVFLEGGAFALLVADGLGHGEKAAEAAQAAVDAFGRQPAPVERALEGVHRALRATRGAAVAAACAAGPVDGLRYAGIGNVSGSVHTPDAVRKLVSLPGTAGHEVRTVRAFDYEWPDGALLVMHSDGLSARWSLSSYPGLAARHPALVAAVLYRDHGRRRDDATVIVARRPRP